MLHTHPTHQLRLAEQRQREFLRDAQANALARELRPRRPSAFGGVADMLTRRLQRRPVPQPRPRTSQA